MENCCEVLVYNLHRGPKKICYGSDADNTLPFVFRNTVIASYTLFKQRKISNYRTYSSKHSILWNYTITVFFFICSFNTMWLLSWYGTISRRTLLYLGCFFFVVPNHLDSCTLYTLLSEAENKLQYERARMRNNLHCTALCFSSYFCFCWVCEVS